MREMMADPPPAEKKAPDRSGLRPERPDRRFVHDLGPITGAQEAFAVARELGHLVGEPFPAHQVDEIALSGVSQRAEPRRFRSRD
ncbi:hypothetical protein [Marinicauda algicola]|uniref:hypothetical protein n=1 Tax=Marinicauda algicola TaxID=2029849 RepID=UPI001305369D|nr:hypothetical protein [Marinicauda algicola]